MILLKKFLCCIPLQIGCTLIGYALVLHGFGVFIAILFHLQLLCGRMAMLWVMHCQTNIIAGILLLGACADPLSLYYLLPIQVVVKMTSLIIELLFYLSMASSDIKDPSTIVAYSFLSIICNAYIIIVTISFYQALEDAF